MGGCGALRLGWPAAGDVLVGMLDGLFSRHALLHGPVDA